MPTCVLVSVDGGVVVGDRRAVGDRDGDGGGVGGDPVGDGVVEGVGALEPSRGGVDEPVALLDDGAAARGGLVESGDTDRVAVGVGVVLEDVDADLVLVSVLAVSSLATGAALATVMVTVARLLVRSPSVAR